VLALVGLFLGAATATADDPAARAKQIAELEQKLADLQKQLAELKKSAPPAKLRPLTLADAATWRGIGAVSLSPDGKWFGYRVGPAEGDQEVVLRSTTGDKETKWPAGGGFGSLAFSRDSKWFAFTVSPSSRAAPGAGPRPAADGKVVLINTASGAKTEFEGVRRFAFSGEAATHLALHRAPGGVAAAPFSFLTSRTMPTAAPTSSASGSDLLLHELATGVQLNLGNVSEFAFDKKGRWLALVIDSPGQIGNGVQLRDMTTAALLPLETGKASYRSLVWTRKGDGFTVLKGVEDTAYADRLYSIIGFTDLGPKTRKVEFNPREHANFPKDMTVSPNRTPAWTENLSGFVFGIHAVKKKDPAQGVLASLRLRPQAGTTGATDKPDLVIWHWADERLQSQQQVQASFDKSFNYLCVYRVAEKRFVRLADESLRQVTAAPHERWAIGHRTKPYRRQATLHGRSYQDVFVVDMHTGARRQVLTRNRWYFGPSPDGTHFLYYDEGRFHTCDMATGTTYPLETDGAGTFVDVEDDHNITKPPRRPVGWTPDGAAVLLSDGWDIWKVAVHGGPAVNLTGDGKRNGIRYRGFITLDPEQRGIDLSKPAYVALHSHRNKKAGFGRIEPGQTGVRRLCWDDAAFSQLLKARDADVFVYTRETYRDYPDYHVTDATFTNARRLTRANPQQEKVAWCGGVRLLEYTSKKGDKLHAALLLPANHEPGKRYPTVVYIYERLSDMLNRYSAPGTSGFNPALYTSNGYAVLLPDIKYQVNDPGMSAVWCVLPALDAAVATGVVDRDRVGLHGHSWGGYQTAFLITQTDAFKAAVAGAPLTDLVSMYSSIYWNAGIANQPIFESSQGRFSGPYWENLDAYVRNSPVHHARNVKTPLLLLHNDKDGAVDWNQGIEYFNTLRRMEKPVVLLQYKGENHGLAKPANRKDYTRRMREFFDHHLMGKPAPTWLKEGVPHLSLDEHLAERAKEEK
jgi:dipeptidyl aminopeptidase/acylaminoacyl peptidase